MHFCKLHFQHPFNISLDAILYTSSQKHVLSYLLAFLECQENKYWIIFFKKKLLANLRKIAIASVCRSPWSLVTSYFELFVNSIEWSILT